MRDVLGTIAADQDAIIRASSRGALVVDGGPGTGKTVVALHRAAYLLYSDPRLRDRTGRVLFIGPHQPYLDYVGDVLPSLGEDGVQTGTLRHLIAEGAVARPETDPNVARLKAAKDLVDGIEVGVRFYEDAPTTPITLTTDEGTVTVTADDWAEAFAATDPGTPHNQAREQIWSELLTILTDKYEPDDDTSTDVQRRASVARSRDLLATFNRAWPLLDATDLVADLWTVPAYLRLCARHLTPDDVRALQRTDARAWTTADLPLLDAARRRLGDPDEVRRRRRDAAELATRQAEMATVIDDLIASDDSEMMVMSMLRRPDMQYVLVDEAAERSGERDVFAGPFAHVVVDEAQELTDAEWQLLIARCPSRSFTIVGDRAQARHGFTESWTDRLTRVGLDEVTVASLSINYRTPAEIMAEAEPVIRGVLPDANVPTSIRSTGVPVHYAPTAERDAIIDDWLATHAEGIACVIGDPAFPPASRVRSLAPELAKGLEFDLVVLVDPHEFGPGIEGAVDRYVAMTRATQLLVVLTSQPAD
jgi:DNA helicase IV